MLEEGITGDRAFVEADNLGPVLHRAAGQRVDPGEVICFIDIAVLELGCGDSDVSHGSVLFGQTGNWLSPMVRSRSHRSDAGSARVPILT